MSQQKIDALARLVTGTLGTTRLHSSQTEPKKDGHSFMCSIMIMTADWSEHHTITGVRWMWRQDAISRTATCIQLIDFGAVAFELLSPRS